MLEADRIVAGYDGTPVLRDVSLAVPDGAVVALLGPNGAGKTTLLRVLSGLLPPDGGRVLVDGADVTGRAPHRLVELGIQHVPEGRGVFPALTVRENLVVYSEAGRETDSIANAVEAFPRLGERINQPAGTLSGGEQQMLALARASMCSPRFVLLDEVSMGLAPRIVDEIFASLERLAHEQGRALLLVEQYVTKALELADYVYVLSRGRIAYAGEPSELADDDLFARYLGADIAS
jgi:branched-chain amino acid transport system ATP-binding protein